MRTDKGNTNKHALIEKALETAFKVNEIKEKLDAHQDMTLEQLKQVQENYTDLLIQIVTKITQHKQFLSAALIKLDNSQPNKPKSSVMSDIEIAALRQEISDVEQSSQDLQKHRDDCMKDLGIIGKFIENMKENDSRRYCSIM